jgi:hypothetical protein
MATVPTWETKMDFENDLNELVDKAKAAGVSNEEIIGAFELKTMALNEGVDDDEIDD